VKSRISIFVCLLAAIAGYAGQALLLHNLDSVSRLTYDRLSGLLSLLSIAGGVGVFYSLGRQTVYRNIEAVTTDQKFILVAGSLFASLMPYYLIGTGTDDYPTTILSNSRDTTARVISIYVRKNVKGQNPKMAVASFFPTHSDKSIVFEQFRDTLEIGDLIRVRYYVPNPDHFIIQPLQEYRTH
jgi:hypothetical protein